MIPEKKYTEIIENVPILCVDGIIINDEKEYLLVKRLNDPLRGEYWVPGGRVLKHELLKDAIKRKMKQELGIDIFKERLLGYFEDIYEKSDTKLTTDLHVISFVYLVNSNNQQKIILDYQSVDSIWSKELPKRLINKLQLFREKII